MFSNWTSEGKATLMLVGGVCASAASFVLWPTKRLLLIPATVVYALGLRKVVAGNTCDYKADLHGKVAVITGANTGIGKTTAIELTKRGCHVIIACRNLDKAADAVKEIQKSINTTTSSSSSSPSVEAMQLDLSSLESVREFVSQFEARKLPCHILLNNAGVMRCPYSHTKDGFEMQFGTNHLGHFLLTNLMLPTLKESKARIVNVSSRAHSNAIPGTSFHDMAFPDRKGYSPSVAYGYSKLANILFTQQLQKRLDVEGSGATTYSLHPGVIRTELARHLELPTPVKWLFMGVSKLMFKTPEEGAQTSLYCCIDPNAKPGAYHSDCRVVPTTAEGRNEERGRELWELSEKWVGLKK